MKVTGKNPNYAEAMDAAESMGLGRARPIAMLNITRTITDHIELARDPDSMGLTIGQQIDNHLRNAAEQGETIQTVALEFERDEWYDFARAMRGDPRRD